MGGRDLAHQSCTESSSSGSHVKRVCVCVCVQGMEKEYELADKSKWVKVSRDASIAEICAMEDHIVGGFPVLHVVEENSVFERHLLHKGPTIF